MSDTPTELINLSVQAIRLESFEVKDAGVKLQHHLDTTNGYEFGLSFNIGPGDGPERIIAKLTTILKNKNTKEDLASLTTAMEFNVSNRDSFMRVNEAGAQQMLNGAMQIFASIIFSTTRGIFTMQAATTKFHNAFLPVIDMSKFLTAAAVPRS